MIFGPTFVIAFLRGWNLNPKSKIGNAILEVTICASVLAFALPMAISAFPQRGSLPASALEPEFHGLKNKEGLPIERFYFNKGL